MRNAIIKASVIGTVFLIALIVISNIVNKGNNDLTVEMPPATYPLIYMKDSSGNYNCLHGYGKPMDTAFERDTISLLGENRDTNIQIESFGRTINSLGYEIRSVDGERLIENAENIQMQEDGKAITAHIAVKDLIEKDTEYSLVILLQSEEGEIIRYYTRVIWGENYALTEKLNFVKGFHESIFDKEQAREYSRYLESNASGDNTTLNKVDIHSSFQQVTWGDLIVKKEGSEQIDIVELTNQIGGFEITYLVSTSEGKTTIYYRVKEYYRVRYTSDRMYLLNYERTMNQFFPENATCFENNKIDLGIISSDFEFVESEDGNIIVFKNEGRLFSYNIVDNKLSVLFSFFDDENWDERTLYNQHEIEVLNVDEGGNIQFLIYGYMNRGRHEGEVGIQVYFYNSSLNTVEEAIYIPYDKSAEILMSEMKQLQYMNRRNELFFLLEGSVYVVDLDNKTYELLTEDVRDGSIKISQSHKMVVWQNGENLYECRELMLLDLNTRKQMQLNSIDGEYILPLGFMGEDLIYGLARQADLAEDNAGRLIFPMYAVYIQNAEGTVLMEQKEENVYITSCDIKDNQIVLTQVSKDSSGNYVEVPEEQITNNVEREVSKNSIQKINAGSYQRQIQIVLKSNVDTKNLKTLTPKEVLFEGGRELVLENTESVFERFYVYDYEGIRGIFMNPANAVNVASENTGIVINDQGNEVFRKGNRVVRNQIMAIQGRAATEEQSSLAVCLDTILELEELTKNTQVMLNQGEMAKEILENNLTECQILDLSGCSLDSVLYYVNRDLPVLALLKDGSALLIVGFNELNVAVMDPKTGTIYKKGMNDSSQWFDENGNNFITYIPR